MIFKNDLDNDCVDLPVEQRETVAVLTVAAPRLPAVKNDRLSKSEDVHDLREKIKLVYRMAGHNGKQVLVLGRCQSQFCAFLGLLLIYVQAPWGAACTVAHHVMSLRR